MPARTTPRYPYPRTNGRYLQYASNTVTINGTTFYDIPSIDGLSDKVDRSLVKGLSRMPLGMTAGTYEAEDLKLEFFTTVWPQVESVLDKAGGGIFDSGEGEDQGIQIHIEIFEDGLVRQTRDWVGLTVSAISESYSEGNEPLKMSVTFKPIAMVRNGHNPIRGVDLKVSTNQLLVTNSV